MKSKIIAYTVSSHPDIIRPASPNRQWMDESGVRFAYRCLPLSMANSWGWEILSSAKFTATWDGHDKSSSNVKVTVHEGTNAPKSHFGEATLTWHTGYTFRTEYPIGLYVVGSPNFPKPNVIPLAGIVETNWLTYTFTMNWKFTQPGSFTMDIGEPYCQIFPVDLNTFENITPEIRTLEDDKEFHDLYWDWNISRANFLVGHQSLESGSKPSSWQKHYFQGKYPSGKVHPEGAKCPVHTDESGETKSVHRTKPNVPEFVDLQTKPFKTVSDYVERTKEANDKRKEHMENLRKQHEVSTNPNVTITNNIKPNPNIVQHGKRQSVPIPEHHRQMFIDNAKAMNDLYMKIYQLTDINVQNNMNAMKSLGLNPNDGWRIDMPTVSYVKD